MLERYRFLPVLWDRGAYGGFAFYFPGGVWFWRLHMIPHFVFEIRCHSRCSTEDSPATVLLRHRLGRRVAAEAGPATMLLRYRLGARLVGVALHTFLEEPSLESFGVGG